MIRKSMLLALLGWSLTGCVAYGDGGYRDYDRAYYYPDARIERAPVYVAPRVYVYEERRYPPARYYAPPPPARYFNAPPGYDPRWHGRHDRDRRDYRPAPQPGWEAQRHHYQQRQRSQGAPLQWQQRDSGPAIQRGWTRER